MQKQKNLETLKSLFLETAKAKSETPSGTNYDLKKLLADSGSDDDDWIIDPMAITKTIDWLNKP